MHITHTPPAPSHAFSFSARLSAAPTRLGKSLPPSTHLPKPDYRLCTLLLPKPKEIPCREHDQCPNRVHTQGGVEFRNVTLAYRANLPPALRHTHTHKHIHHRGVINECTGARDLLSLQYTSTISSLPHSPLLSCLFFDPTTRWQAYERDHPTRSSGKGGDWNPS